MNGQLPSDQPTSVVKVIRNYCESLNKYLFVFIYNFLVPPNLYYAFIQACRKCLLSRHNTELIFLGSLGQCLHTML